MHVAQGMCGWESQECSAGMVVVGRAGLHGSYIHNNACYQHGVNNKFGVFHPICQLRLNDCV